MRRSSKWKGIFIRVISPAVLIATLKDAVARLHAEASHMSEAEQSPARQQADAIDEAAEDIKTGMMEMHNHGSYTDQRGASGNSSNHIGIPISNNTSEPWVIALCCTSAVLSVIAMCGLWWCAKEFKQVQIQLMYSNALMLREGLIKPGDEVYGPEGNLMYKQHELQRKE